MYINKVMLYVYKFWKNNDMFYVIKIYKLN